MNARISRVFHDAGEAVDSHHRTGSAGVTSITALHQSELAVATRLREQLVERDEIIVALQHVIRDLRHEIDNLRAEDAYATFARRRNGSSSG